MGRWIEAQSERRMSTFHPRPQGDWLRSWTTPYFAFLCSHCWETGRCSSFCSWWLNKWFSWPPVVLFQTVGGLGPLSACCSETGCQGGSVLANVNSNWDLRKGWALAAIQIRDRDWLMGSRWYVWYMFCSLGLSQLFSRNASYYTALSQMLHQMLQMLHQTKMIPQIGFDLAFNLLPMLLPILPRTHCVCRTYCYTVELFHWVFD